MDQYKPDTRPLKVKCKEKAIHQIKQAKTRDEANVIYKFWVVFHNDSDFKEAIKLKQIHFSKL